MSILPKCWPSADEKVCANCRNFDKLDCPNVTTPPNMPVDGMPCYRPNEELSKN